MRGFFAHGTNLNFALGAVIPCLTSHGSFVRSNRSEGQLPAPRVGFNKPRTERPKADGRITKKPTLPLSQYGRS
jgi:hypothetical protein